MITKYRAVFIGIGAFIITLLAFRYITPFGSVVRYQFSANSDKSKINQVNGIENVESFPTGKDNGAFSLLQQVIRKNVASFQLKLLSQAIDGIWVKLRFKGNPKEIKVGVRGSTSEKYLYKPLYNQAIESLTWNRMTSGDVSLWQKERVFNVFDSFVKSPPKDKTIATYFVDPASFFVGGIVEGNGSVTIDTPLRGSHTLYISVDKKPFLLTVSKQDANQYLGDDILSIQVYLGDKKLAEKVIPDDGITEKNGLTATPQKAQITLSDPDLGVYKVLLKDNSNGGDVRIVKIEVNQSKVDFGSPVFDLDSKPVSMVTNSKKVTMTTFHKTSSQTVRLDDSVNLDVAKENVKYVFDLDHPATGSANIQSLHTLVMPKNDLIVSGDGVFAFTNEAFFDPQPVKTVDVSKLSNLTKADYVVAAYTPVVKEGEWLTAQAYINPKDIIIDGDNLYFSLESPDLESKGGEIVVDTLDITTTKPSWFSTPVEATTEAVKVPGLWQRIVGWFQSHFGAKSTPTPVPQVSPTPTVKVTPSPTLSADTKAKADIMVQNGGAVHGSASNFVAKLQKAGYQKARVGTDLANYKKATIVVSASVKTSLAPVLDDLTRLLAPDYDQIVLDASGSGQTVRIILGEKAAKK